MASKSSSKSPASQGKSGQSFVSAPTKTPAPTSAPGKGDFSPTKPQSAVAAGKSGQSFVSAVTKTPAPVSAPGKVSFSPAKSINPSVAGKSGMGYVAPTQKITSPKSAPGKVDFQSPIAISRSLAPSKTPTAYGYDNPNPLIKGIRVATPQQVATFEEMQRETARAKGLGSVSPKPIAPRVALNGPTHRPVGPQSLSGYAINKALNPRLGPTIAGDDDPQFSDFRAIDSPEPLGDKLGYAFRREDAKPALADYGRTAPTKIAKYQGRVPQDPNYVFNGASPPRAAPDVASLRPASFTDRPASDFKPRGETVVSRSVAPAGTYMPEKVVVNAPPPKPMAKPDALGWGSLAAGIEGGAAAEAKRVASLKAAAAAIKQYPQIFAKAHDAAWVEPQKAADASIDGGTDTPYDAGVAPDPTSAPAGKTIFDQNPTHNLYGGPDGTKEPVNGALEKTLRYTGLGRVADIGNWLANLPAPQPGAAQSLDARGEYISGPNSGITGNNGSGPSGALASLLPNLTSPPTVPTLPTALTPQPAATGALQSIYRPPINYYTYGFNPEQQMFSNNSIG